MPGIVIALAAVVAVVTIVLMLRTRGEQATLPPVIGIFGFGLIAVMLVGGQFFRDARRRDADAEARDYLICKTAVEARAGLRQHFDWLYDEIAAGPPSPERDAFLIRARAQLDIDIPRRTLADCPPDPRE